MMANASWTSPAVGIDVCAHLPGKGTTAVWVRGRIVYCNVTWAIGLFSKILFPGLTACTLLAEDLSLGTITHIGCFIAAYNCSSNAVGHPWPLQASALTCAHVYT